MKKFEDKYTGWRFTLVWVGCFFLSAGFWLGLGWWVSETFYGGGS